MGPARKMPSRFGLYSAENIGGAAVFICTVLLPAPVSAVVAAKDRIPNCSDHAHHRTRGPIDHSSPAVRSSGATARAVPLVCRSPLHYALHRSAWKVVFM